MELAGRVAIITGGAKGIGYQTTRLLLMKGVTCSIWDIDEVKGVEAANALSEYGVVTFCSVDVTDPLCIQKALEHVVETVGKPNILVHSAGIIGDKFSLWETTIEEWNRIIQSNLYSCFLMCRSVIPYMLETDYGRIVNVSSVSGKDGSIHASPYSAAKGGVIALTKALAKDLAPYGVLANCVTPAATNTPAFQAEAEEVRARQVTRIPLGRIAEPVEVAHVIAWLCSPECTFSTGAVFDVSGGRSSY